MRRAGTRARHVLACVLALLLVAGLAPALPEAPRALAEEPGEAIELADDARVGEAPGDDGAEPGDAAGAAERSDAGSPVVLGDEAEDAILRQLELVAEGAEAGGEGAGDDVAGPRPDGGEGVSVGAQAAGVSVSSPRVRADSNMKSGQVATWDCVWFGSYPQTEVAPGDAAYASLQSASWDANGDATVGGERYRRISKSDVTYRYYWSDDGYGSAAYRYFRYEPVKWRVLEVSGSAALVVADVALDDQEYNESYASVTWEYSSVRSWLNGYGASSNQPGTDFSRKSFVGAAFSGAERTAILEAGVANADNTDYGTDGGNDTSDKVFLLSEAEVYDASHGFATNPDTYDEARRCKASDYARAMGAYRYSGGTYDGNCYWWLRSPGSHAPNAAGVRYDGYVVRSGFGVDIGNGAVRPALNLNLASPHPQAAGTVSSDGAADEQAPTGTGGNPGGDPAQAHDLAYAQVSAISTQTHTGNPIEPDFTVRMGSSTLLRKGVDYTVSYSDNVNAGTATVTVTGKGDYVGTLTATFKIAKAKNPLVASATKPKVSVTYSQSKGQASAANLKVAKAKGKVTYDNESAAKAAKAFPVDKTTGRVTVPKGTKSGTYTVSVKVSAAGNKNYGKGSKTVTYKITVAKAANPMRLKAVARTAKLATVRKKAVVVAAPLEIAKKAQGKVTFAKVAKESSELLSVNKKTGKVTVKKGTKKGTYKVKIKVTAAGNANYKKLSKTVTCKVVVK